jgi:hypothetical protein
MPKKFDFSGWATWNDALCADGRVIKHNAFKDNDGQIVPLVYMHGHKSPEDVIGNVLLENRDQGVYCYGSFNNSPNALAAKESVMHGDINHLSIYANHLKHNGHDVIHGDIKEVSLVLAGANPGALIDYVDLAHSEDGNVDAIIYTDYAISNAPGEIDISISHADEEDDDETIEDVWNSFTDEQKDCVYAIIAIGSANKDQISEIVKADFDEQVSHSDFIVHSGSDKTVREIWETLTDKQKKVASFIIADAVSSNKDDMEHDDMNENSLEDVLDTFSDEQIGALNALIDMVHTDDEDEIEMIHSDFCQGIALYHGDDYEGETIEDIWDSMTPEQQDVAALIVADSLDDEDENDSDEDQDDSEEEYDDDEDVEHADMSEENIDEIWDSMNDDQKEAVEALIELANAEDDEEIEVIHSDFCNSIALCHGDDLDGDFTIEDVWDSMTPEQQDLAALLVADNMEHSDINEGGNDMSRNLFENDSTGYENVLTHADMEAVLADIKSAGSLRNSVLQHGITNLEVMFPDDKMVEGSPIIYQRDQEWVTDVLNGVSKSPFAKIKCIYADITGADARAKGFLGATQHKDPATGKPYRDSKGNLVDENGNRVYKEEEIIPLIKRTVSPTTVYKKQRLDRNDIVDITDFDVVVWLKAEMKVMLNEEVARAILIGDGRAAGNADKVDETCIKPIWTDDDFYTIKAPVTVEATDTDDTVAAKLVDMAVLAKKDYKGSGATVFFANEDYVTRMLLLKDSMGHRLYDTEEKLASAMRVSRIVSVPVMQNATRVDSDGKTRNLVGIIVNLRDYRVGTDKKGAVTMFDDFDIDYNQEKYLIETRLSGMMVQPKSAIALETKPE